MFELFIWVPTKGWKLIKKSKDAENLKELQRQLEPLETKLQGKNFVEWKGKLCMPV